MPRRRLGALLPDDLRRYGAAGIEIYRSELPRRIAEASAELVRIEIAEQAVEEQQAVTIFCTRCRQAAASPGRKRCERCRERHRAYMAHRRGDPGYRAIEQAHQNERRAVFGRGDAQAVAEARAKRLRAARRGELMAQVDLDVRAAALFAESDGA